MAFDIIKWIIMILIILVTLGVLFGLIWGSLLEERSYSKRSKAKKEKEVEKNLQMASGHTDEDELNEDSTEDISRKENHAKRKNKNS